MLSVIDRFAAESFITPQEAELAAEASQLGDPTHTLGYELEVMPAAIDKVPALGALQGEKPQYSKPGYVEGCTSILARLGYDTALDGLYEARSPVSQHPLPLAIATRGLVRAGVLPDQAGESDVTAHVNIGTATRLTVGSPKHYQLIRMLRAVELAGGASRERLAGTLEPAGDPQYSYTWHTRGVAGVSFFIKSKTKWQGNNGRVELRSLSYQNPEQFERTLEAVYYLSRGLLSPNIGETKIFERFDKWFKGYMHRHNLKDISLEHTYPELAWRLRDRTHMRAYIRPFLEHRATADNTELVEAMTEAIEQLR